MDIVQFYLGKAPDDHGRMLQDIWGWDYDALEGVHNYIQVLFPLDEPSMFNARAPVLDEATFARLRASHEVRANLLRSFRLMLDFYGFRLDEQTGEVGRAEHFARRAAEWLVPGDHNHLRITRILRCLRLCGLGDYAAAFLRRLEQEADPRSVSTETLAYWRNAVREESR